MKNLEFLVFALLLFSGVMAGHMALQLTLSKDPVLMTQLEHVERQKREADLRAEIAADRLADFQSQVATLLPSKDLGAGELSAVASSGGRSRELPSEISRVAELPQMQQPSYPLRQLASVVTEQRDLKIERASSLMERGKASFREREFEKSNQVFEDVIRLYPESVHVAEANFLLAEGQFQTKEYEASIATIERMIALFPENELTGFALLRLGRIYELQDRLEDASDIYKSVLANFKQPQWVELRNQATDSLKGVHL